ncbi:MAG: YceI family protein [Bryobacteraceae bacterium]
MTAPEGNEIPTVRYLIDKSSSKFTVRAFAGGMLSALGHSPTFGIRKFEGEIEFAPQEAGTSSLRLAVEADSLEVMDDISSKDRREIEGTMNKDVLESAKYPAISFETISATVNKLGEARYQVSLTGKITLHGVTRQLVIPAQVTEMGDMLRAGGEFPLMQTNFGIKLVNAAGGTLKVKDELKFTFDIVARKPD